MPPRQPLQPSLLLRREGLVRFALATGAYLISGGGWVLFLVLLLAPDVSMAGPLADRRIGSTTYNLAHTVALPAVLLAGAWYAGWPLGTGLPLIWLAHIGADRAMGLGLEYPDASFTETHVQRV